MKLFFIISFSVISGLCLGAVAGTAMIMALSIESSAGGYIGAVQGAIFGLLCSPFFIFRRDQSNIFSLMVICLVLTFPISLISGLTMNPWLSIGLTFLSYFSVYYFSSRKSLPDTNDLFKKKTIYIVPLVCLIVASVIVHNQEDKSLPDDITSLIEMMGDNDIERHMSAARKLKRHGKSPFLVALKNKNPKVRSVAAHFLGLLNDPSVQDALIISSNDSDPYVRMWSAFSLGEIGDAKALPTLRSLANDNKEIVRSRAREAMEKLQERKQIEEK